MIEKKYNDLALYCSTSIENFREKLKRRFDLPRWHFLRSMGKHAIFFGMYHEWDVFRFIWHRGKKTVFWCGGDILNIQKRPFLRWLILRLSTARHICENVVEQEALRDMGIESDIHPCLFDKIDDIEISYKQSDSPKVFGVYHKGREREYGYFEHPQIDWFCDFPEKEFNEKIKEYQGCIRLNEFDGFSEVLAKSVLMGQYQFSVIPYPYMASGDLGQWLEDLENKKEPNYEGRNYWKKKLNESLYEILQ